MARFQVVGVEGHGAVEVRERGGEVAATGQEVGQGALRLGVFGGQLGRATEMLQRGVGVAQFGGVAASAEVAGGVVGFEFEIGRISFDRLGVAVGESEAVGQAGLGARRFRVARQGLAVVGERGGGVAGADVDLSAPEKRFRVARRVGRPHVQDEAGAAEVVHLQVDLGERLVDERVGRLVVERVAEHRLGLGEPAGEREHDRVESVGLSLRRP